MAVSRPTLVLRLADVGRATYGSLRVVGDPSRTVTWVIEEPLLLAALAELRDALPEPVAEESVGDALRRALVRGPLATRSTEHVLAYRLGVLLLSDGCWRLLAEFAPDPRAVVFVSPSARLARVPWGLLAWPLLRPEADSMVRARVAAVTVEGTSAARIPWPEAEPSDLADGRRLLDLVDVLMSVPANIANATRPRCDWSAAADRPPLLILDPRVPGQRADSSLGSVLGRPHPDTPVAQHFSQSMSRGRVLPDVGSAVELFRRTDVDRRWLAAMLAAPPGRLLYVGHATAAESGSADRSALHLADEQPLTAGDVMSLALPIPPRVALLACASGGDYRFDEATGLVAAMVLGGAQLVTATLWSLPTTAGYRQFTGSAADPMSDVVVAIDRAHQDVEAGGAINRWQRDELNRWRSGDPTASPLYWAAMVSFAVDGAR
ncbi:CHAT domain-containing protein [Mycolicibacterium sediminis]|uniref:CHAT domain-containing protein n=1 Tax=Mycolicibacterium sediminis TaxID=1286180 RepID=A0A7I7QUE3_9MYCO|nr:CHAT domain-containing protein [Mycolicibacterium sediminis]BBY29875.1 CHAT domain-containing protein [Mycolicibacterium sediminis]